MNTTPELYTFTLDEGEPVIAHDIREAWALFDKYRSRIVSASREPFKTALNPQKPTKTSRKEDVGIDPQTE